MTLAFPFLIQAITTATSKFLVNSNLFRAI